MADSHEMISMQAVMMKKYSNCVVVVQEGRTYMIENGDGIVTTLSSQPPVDGLLSVVGDHYIHSQLCQLPIEWMQHPTKIM